jgi:hypothetical protein
MMSSMWLTVLSGLLSAALAAAGAAPIQRMLTDQVGNALGVAAERPTDPGTCIGRATAGEFSVCLQGPEQRIAMASAAAKQAHRRLRSAYVSEEMKAQEWSVIARPNAPALIDGRGVKAPVGEQISVQLHEHPDQRVEPLKMEPMPVEWGNAIGVTVKGQGVTARFHMPMLPEGDLDIVIQVAGGGERRYPISRALRAQIR